MSDNHSVGGFTSGIANALRVGAAVATPKSPGCDSSSSLLDGDVDRRDDAFESPPPPPLPLLPLRRRGRPNVASDIGPDRPPPELADVADRRRGRHHRHLRPGERPRRRDRVALDLAAADPRVVRRAARAAAAVGVGARVGPEEVVPARELIRGGGATHAADALRRRRAHAAQEDVIVRRQLRDRVRDAPRELRERVDGRIRPAVGRLRRARRRREALARARERALQVRFRLRHPRVHRLAHLPEGERVRGTRGRVAVEGRGASRRARRRRRRRRLHRAA
eukprot:30850-Pelagococcus_subviridis.AAC.8